MFESNRKATNAFVTFGGMPVISPRCQERKLCKAVVEPEWERIFQLNKAVYTASSVACFWAGAVTRPYTLTGALAVPLLITYSAEKALSY